jgi:hypothetical protein
VVSGFDYKPEVPSFVDQTSEASNQKPETRKQKPETRDPDYEP